MRNRLYQFVKSPTILAKMNLKRVMTRIQVEKDLSIKATQEVILTGEFNTKLRSTLKYANPDERAKFLHEYMELDDRVNVDGVEISKLDTM